MIKKVLSSIFIILGIFLLLGALAAKSFNAGDDGSLTEQLLSFGVPLALLVIGLVMAKDNNSSSQK